MKNNYICLFIFLTPGYKKFAKHGYPQPLCPPLPSISLASKFADLSSAFLKLLTAVMDAFDEIPNSLDIIKQLLSQLVLPLGNREVVPLIDPKVYNEAVTTRELFRLISPFLNCLSPHLIAYLCEESQCLPAVAAVQDFCTVHDQHVHSVLCIQESQGEEQNELVLASLSALLTPGHFKAHRLALDVLQSRHPLVFRMLNYHRVPSSEPLQTFRLSVEVDCPFLTLQDYNSITNALSAVFLLPNIALVYAGCFTSPTVLTWLVPAQLLPYLKNQPVGSTTSGERLLAEQGVVAVAIGDNTRIKCLTLKVCLKTLHCTVANIDLETSSTFCSCLNVAAPSTKEVEVCFSQCTVSDDGSWIIIIDSALTKPFPIFSSALLHIFYRFSLYITLWHDCDYLHSSTDTNTNICSGHTHPQEVQLREAALYDLVEWIPQLVQEGADINAADMVGCDVLMHNSLAQHATLCQQLHVYMRAFTSYVCVCGLCTGLETNHTLHREYGFIPSTDVAICMYVLAFPPHTH